MKIEKSELLRYLGYKGQEYGERLDEEIDGAIRLCLELVTPRSVIRKYPFDSSSMKIIGADISLLGEDIRRHLAGCNEVYFLGATVGFAVEKKVAELMKTNPLAGVLLDSASICAIESYCDDLCDELQANCDKALTWRFSCGYGDFPLSQQKDFVNALELPKRIGVFMNEDSFMLTPQKTVTAVIGVKENCEKSERACNLKCAACKNTNCAYRR